MRSYTGTGAQASYCQACPCKLSGQFGRGVDGGVWLGIGNRMPWVLPLGSRAVQADVVRVAVMNARSEVLASRSRIFARMGTMSRRPMAATVPPSASPAMTSNG